MTKKITTRDWEALSAYLDGQLAQKERARLEINLRDSQDLRTALDELRRTRAVLRSQPRLRAPRNFTLTSEMAGVRATQRSGSPVFPFFRLASALATLLLVLVFAGDFLTSRQPAAISMNASAPAATAPSLLVAPAEANPYPGIGTSEAAPVPNQKLMAVQPTQEATPQPGIGAFEAAPASTPGPLVEAPAQSETNPGALSEPSGGGGAPPEAQLQQDEAVPTESPPRQAAPAEQPNETAPTQKPAAQFPWRVMEAALASIALLSGLVAYFIHRSSNV
jgi:hypothetical protein